MTNEEIVKKAIEKAQKNGWYSENIFKVVHYDGSIGTSMFIVGAFNDDGNTEAWRRDVETLIFQSYFAKAFWGEKDMWSETACSCGGVGIHANDDMHTMNCTRAKANRGYKFHLMEMVIEEDRIKYLERFL